MGSLRGKRLVDLQQRSEASTKIMPEIACPAGMATSNG